MDVHDHRPPLGAQFTSSILIDVMTTNTSSFAEFLGSLQSGLARKTIRILALDPKSDFAKYRYKEIGFATPDEFASA